MTKFVLAGLLSLGLGTAAFALETPSVTVTVKGVLQQDKNGFFIHVDGSFYDVVINDENKADMQKFYTGLEGDMVQVTGALHVQDAPNGKSSMVVYTNDIARLKGEKYVRSTTVTEPVVVREYYVEHPRGIHLPGVHINW